MNHTLEKSSTIFSGKVFDIVVDDIIYNQTGNKGIREVVVHHGGAVVVALTPEYKILMVTQFRYPLQKYLMELPAGKLSKEEDPRECALRELEEETGFTAGKISKLGSISTSPGFCTEILHIYLAEELSYGKINREEGEDGMEVHQFSLKEIDEKILNGEIIDAKSICGIMLAKLYMANN